MKTRQLALDSVLAAMCAVLGFVSLDFTTIKITLESIPVVLGALLFGPLDGLLIGFIGTLLSQLLHYGLSVTTLLWILPYAACGLVAGVWAKAKKFRMNKGEIVAAVIVSELVVTALNTLALYVDSRIFGYDAAVLAMILPRIGVAVVKSVIIGVVLPPLMQVIRKTALAKKAE